MKTITRMEFFEQYSENINKMVQENPKLKELVDEYSKMNKENHERLLELRSATGFSALFSRSKQVDYDDTELKLADLEAKIINEINTIESFKGWKVSGEIVERHYNEENNALALTIQGHGKIHNEAYELAEIPAPDSLGIKQRHTSEMINEFKTCKYAEILYKFPTIMSDAEHGYIEIENGNVKVIDMKIIAVYPQW